MTIAVVETSQAAGDSGFGTSVNITLNLPGSTAVGDLLLNISYATTGGGTNISSWSTLSGFTLVSNHLGSYNGGGTIQTRVVDGTEPSSWNEVVTIASADEIYVAGVLLLLSGVDLTAPIDGSAGFHDDFSATSVTVPSITTTYTGMQIASFYSSTRRTQGGTPSGLTFVAESTTRPTFRMYDVTLTSSGATPTYTQSFSGTTGDGLGVTVALKPGPLTPPTSPQAQLINA